MVGSKKLLAVMFSLVSSSAFAGPVDLNDWTEESATAGAGNWNVAPDGSVVTQTINGLPSIYYSDFNAFGTEATGTIRVSSSGGDDDYIGFVLGFNPGDATNSSADYLLVDWKRTSQNFNFGGASTDPGGVADRGLAVSRVSGIPSADESWQHTTYGTDGGLVELARGATLGSTGWAFNTDYEFSFDFGPNNLVVAVNGVEQFNLTGSFNDGRMGFYNFSQAQVTYSAFDVDEGSFSVPEPGSMVLLLAGLIGLGSRRRV